MNLKKFVVGVLIGVLSCSLVACGNAKKEEESTASTIKTIEKGKLLVAMECQYPPFNWTQVNDSNSAAPIKDSPTFANGYDVQIAQRVAKELGLKLEVVKLPWDSLAPAVATGVADVVMAGMSPTAERRQSADFSEPYYNSQLVVVVKKDGAFAKAKTFSDFKNAKLTAQVNTFHAKALTQIKGANIQQPMKDFAAMRESLKSGIIDGYVSEKPEGLSASHAIDDFTFIEFGDKDCFIVDKNDIAIAAAVKKGNKELLEAINKSLAKISDEDRENIMKKAIEEQPSAN